MIVFAESFFLRARPVCPTYCILQFYILHFSTPPPPPLPPPSPCKIKKGFISIRIIIHAAQVLLPAASAGIVDQTALEQLVRVFFSTEFTLFNAVQMNAPQDIFYFANLETELRQSFPSRDGLWAVLKPDIDFNGINGYNNFSN